MSMSFTAARALLREAAGQGVSLWAQNDQLRYRATSGAPSATLLAGLAANTDAILAELSRATFKPRQRTGDLVEVSTYSTQWWHETQVHLSISNGLHQVTRVRGELTTEEIVAAVHAACSRHDLLHAAVTLIDGTPFLRFERARQVLVSSQAVESLVWAPLESGTLFRSFVIRLAAHDHLVGFVLHHFIGDFYSRSKLAQELLCSLGSGMPSGTLSLQYSDYLLAIKAWLSGSAPRHRLAYWQQQLRDAPATRLPDAQECPPLAVLPLGVVHFAVDAALRAQLTRVAAETRVTLGVVLLAAQFRAMAMILRQTDLVITSIVSGRDDPTLLTLIGNTVNLLPVRITLTPEMSGGELLEQVSEAQRLAGKYQVPWGLLVENLQGNGITPVWPTFNLLPGNYGGITRGGPPFNFNGRTARSAKLLIERIPVAKLPEMGSSAAHPSHQMLLYDSGQGLYGVVKYLSCRYSGAGIEQFVALFMECLRSIAAIPRSGSCLG